MISAVYFITCEVSGRVYVGSTRDWVSREKSHRYVLGRGEHHCHHLQNAWDKYGAKQFVFEVAELVLVEELTAREQFYLDAGRGRTLMNASLRASHPVLTSEGLEQMTRSCVQAWKSEERRKNQSEKMKAAWARDPERKRRLDARNQTYWTDDQKKAHGDRLRGSEGHEERQKALRAHNGAYWATERREAHSALKSNQPRKNGKFVCAPQ